MTAIAARPERVRLSGQRQQSLALVHFRLMLVMLMFLGATTAIGLRIFYLAVAGNGAAHAAGIGGMAPARADIIDRNGVPLARTIDAWSIAVHPNRLVNPPEELAPKLAELMPERSEAEYLRILKSGKTFAYLKRRAMPELVAAVNALGEPAMALAREPERMYPQTALAAHVLGWTNSEGQGVTGMEAVLEQRLSDPARRGQPVALSIDSRVQAAMESELSAAMAKHSAVGGAGLILDVRTGEVMAMASLPSFNPNAPARAATLQGAVSMTSAGEPDERFNRVTQAVYELGSTFKILTAAAALEHGVVTSMSTKYDATAPLQVGRFRIRDDHAQNRWMNLPEMMIHSSNIVTARIAEQLGEQRERAFFQSLGFGTAPDIELAEKARPLWPSYWGRTTVMTIGFGHGIAVTPLHLASAYAAVVNGGTWRPATLMKRAPNQVPAGRRVISEATSHRVRQLLRLVVLPAADGTGKSADIPGFRVGGKTGTAEKPHRGGYKRNALVSTFAGVFPMDDPAYVIIMMLDEPKGTKDTYGFASAAWTVAPAVKRTLARVGPMLGVQPDLNKDVDVSELMPLLWRPEGGAH